MNPDLTIAEAFSACGIDYHGHYARLFRMETGMTPREYREQLLRDRERRDGRILSENHTIPSIRHAPQLIE
jgi:AraC-like DNA-binding protein